MLSDAGIVTIAELRAVGAVDAFVAVRATGAKPSLNLLYAIAAGLQDRDWRDLTKRERLRLAQAVA